MTAFDVTLDMLIKNNEATVLANSKVVTINGHEASISMVDVVPYILSSGGVGGQVQVARRNWYQTRYITNCKSRWLYNN